MDDEQMDYGASEIPVVATDLANYVNKLLGTDLPKRVAELAKKIRHGVLEPAELVEDLSLFADAQIKLSRTNNLQLNALGRLLGWINNYAFIYIELHDYKKWLESQFLNDGELEKDVQEAKKRIETAIMNTQRVLFRFILDFMFWVNALPSEGAFVFDKLTTRTTIVHQFSGQETKKERKWWW